MNPVNLYAHQVPMVQRHIQLLTKRNVSSDRSETGVGKTVAILAAIKELGVPFAVVAPKTLLSHWRHWIMLFDLHPVAVLGWEACKIGKVPQLYDPKNSGPKWLVGYPDTKILVVFDEAHRAKSKKTLNSRMVTQAALEGHWIALLSATLIQSPLDLLGLAYPLRLVYNPQHAFAYAKRYGVGLNKWRGYDDFSTSAQRKALHGELDKVGLRVKKADICATMCLHEVDLVDSEVVTEVRRIYDDLNREIAELRAKKTAAVEEITKRLRARQEIELVKVPLFVEEAIRHLEEGSRVTLFLCFTQSINAAAVMLKDQLGESSVGIITGETSLKERDRVIKDYCFGDMRVLVVNCGAGGEGISLHDQDGRFPRVGLLSIPESSTHLIQCLGRNDRVGAKSVGLNRILCVAGTMEEIVYENLSRKIRMIETINDGDLSVLSEIMK